jgi:recombination protein U
MPSNSGKRFEEDIKKSVPSWCWIYRLRDSAGTWQGGENTRFTPSNICDFIVMGKENLYLLELKTHTGASLPISCIRKNQIIEMAKIEKQNVKAYFLINFRDIQQTYVIEAKTMKGFIDTTDRKSIPIKWCIDNGIEVTGEKKRTRFYYSLEQIFKS